MKSIKGGCDVNCTITWDTTSGCASESRPISGASVGQIVSMADTIMSMDSSVTGYNISC